jgi:hypothetical protein
MPEVGKQHFDYTPAGVAKAKRKAKDTGQPLKYDYGKGKGNELSGGKPRASSGRTPSTARRTY